MDMGHADRMQAPRTIDGAHVIMVADLAATRATGSTRHYADGELQTTFERLALAQYDADEQVYIFYCDADWNCLNDTLHPDLASAEARAEKEFVGITFDVP